MKLEHIRICKICNRVNPLNGNFGRHIIKTHEMSVLDYVIKYESFEIPKCTCGENCKTTKGLRFGSTCGSKSCLFDLKSKILSSGETREKLSKARLNWMKANPEKTAWRLGNKQSWPEKFFEEALTRINLDKQFQIVREFSVHPFYVDFALPQIKVAIEIDGAQHNLEYRKIKDEEKDALLASNGWRVYRIAAKFLYSKEDANITAQNLLQFIDSDQTFDEVGFITAKELRAEQKSLDIKVVITKIESVPLGDVISWTNECAKILCMSPLKAKGWIRAKMPDFYEMNKSFIDMKSQQHLRNIDRSLKKELLCNSIKAIKQLDFSDKDEAYKQAAKILNKDASLVYKWIRARIPDLWQQIKVR